MGSIVSGDTTYLGFHKKLISLEIKKIWHLSSKSHFYKHTITTYLLFIINVDMWLWRRDHRGTMPKALASYKVTWVKLQSPYITRCTCDRKRKTFGCVICIVLQGQHHSYPMSKLCVGEFHEALFFLLFLQTQAHPCCLPKDTYLRPGEMELTLFMCPRYSHRHLPNVPIDSSRILKMPYLRLVF